MPVPLKDLIGIITGAIIIKIFSLIITVITIVMMIWDLGGRWLCNCRFRLYSFREMLDATGFKGFNILRQLFNTEWASASWT